MPRPLHVLSLSLASCSRPAIPRRRRRKPKRPRAAAAQPAVPSADEQFADLSKRWLDGSFKLSPVSATQIGDHRFDGELDDLSADGRQRGLDFSKGMLAELDKIDRAKLSRENQVDCGDAAQPAALGHLEHRDAARLGLGSDDLQPDRRRCAVHADGARVRADARSPALGDRAHGEAAEAVRADARESRSRRACRRSTPRRLPSRTRAC